MVKADEDKIKELLTRGVEEIIEKDSLGNKLRSGRELRIKFGIDPTGSKIHLGRAVPLWKLRAFQDLGHKIVLIIGDFTAQIGDASDKEAMRRPLTEQEIKENMKDYILQIGKILDTSKIELHYNSEWLDKMSIGDLLKLAMKFTAQQMIHRRNFKERWEASKEIGLHELLYPLLQGYDSVAVRADIEIGGSDQLFNLLVGREIQKMFAQEPQDIITFKMLPGLDGRKMSTSWGNIITIIDESKEMYGKIMSMKDGLMPEYFELCTVLPPLEIENINRDLQNKQTNPRDIKAKLAREIVSLYYDPKVAAEEDKEFIKIFSEKKVPAKINELKFKNFPDIVGVLLKTEWIGSKAQAWRLVKQGAIEINGKKIEDPKYSLTGNAVIKIGKKHFVKVKLELRK